MDKKPLDQSLIQRAIAGARYIVSGVKPNGFFTPQQPIAPMAQDSAIGRQLDYRAGFNTNIQPKVTEGSGISYAQLRSLADSLDILRLVIETRKDQIEAFKFGIVGKDEKEVPESKLNSIRDRLMQPTPEYEWATWLRMILEDLFVLDAVAIYPRMTRGGGLYSLDLIDSATVKRVIDDGGRTPLPPDPAYQQILHGVPAVDYTSDELIVRMRNPRTNRLYGFCFSPDTEILSKRGWINIGDVTYSHELATRNPDNHSFEWQKPVAVTDREYDGHLINFTAQCVDILVTEEHRMIARCSGRNDVDSRERTMTALELAEKCSDPHWQIPVTCDGWNGIRIESRRFGQLQDVEMRNNQIKSMRKVGATYSAIANTVECSLATVADVVTDRYAYDGRGGNIGTDVKLIGDDYCAFMGMYISEGSVNKGQMVIISQAQHSKHYEKFQIRLEAMFGYVSSTGREHSDFLIHNTALAQHLKQFGHSHEKFVPDDIMNATSDQIEIFLEHLFDGDAHRSKGGAIYYYTVSKRLADQVQELAQKIGKSATIRECPPRSSTMADGRVIKAENCRTQYRVSINRSTHMGVHATRIPYNGKVHCVSVPNQTVYVRRNGYAAWTKQSPCEQIIMTVNIALRRQLTQLQFYSEGNIPEALASVPDTWNPDQVAQFQMYFDSLMQGNTAARSRLKFIPLDISKVKETRDPKLKDEFDEWLARIVCYAFSVPVHPFVREVNRATAQTSKESAAQEGLKPLLAWVERLMNHILVKYMGETDVEFRWQLQEDIDPAIQAGIDKIYVESGIRTANEIREDRGWEKIEEPVAPPVAVPVAQQPQEPTPVEKMHAATLDALGKMAGAGFSQRDEAMAALAKAMDRPAPSITMPDIHLGDTVVNLPEQPAIKMEVGAVNVNVEAAKMSKTLTVERNAEGRIVGRVDEVSA